MSIAIGRRRPHRVIAALLAAGLVTVAAPAAASDAIDSDIIGELPKALRSVGDLTWIADARESAANGLPAWADVTAVGYVISEGPNKLRNRTIRQRTKPANAVANDADRAKGKDLAWVVWNMAGPPPRRLRSDVVAFAGVPGPGSVPFDPTVDSPLTAGSAFMHVIGQYGSQRGAPILTADDSTAGDAPGQSIDFDIPGSGVGGYDRATNSFWSSFVLPNDAEFLSFGAYSTQDGLQLDRVGGIGHTYRVPIDPQAASFECAKVEAYPRADASGTPSGLTDLKVTLVQSPDGTASGFDAQPVLGFASDGADETSRIPQELPASPPDSGIAFWHAVVPSGVVEIVPPDPAGWGLPTEAAPAVWTAFGGVRINGAAEAGGTAFGPSTCGNLLTFEGCTHGGAASWAALGALFDELGAPPLPSDVIESPFPSDDGWTWCVILEEALGPQLAFGISGRPYTLIGHQKALESSPCVQEPIDFGHGGVRQDCGDGVTTYSWLHLGTGAAGDLEQWGWRVEGTVLGGWLDAGTSAVPGLEARFLDLLDDEAAKVLSDAGWTPGPIGGFDISGWRDIAPLADSWRVGPGQGGE